MLLLAIFILLIPVNCGKTLVNPREFVPYSFPVGYKSWTNSPEYDGVKFLECLKIHEARTTLLEPLFWSIISRTRRVSTSWTVVPTRDKIEKEYYDKAWNLYNPWTTNLKGQIETSPLFLDLRCQSPIEAVSRLDFWGNHLIALGIKRFIVVTGTKEFYEAFETSLFGDKSTADDWGWGHPIKTTSDMLKMYFETMKDTEVTFTCKNSRSKESGNFLCEKLAPLSEAAASSIHRIASPLVREYEMTVIKKSSD